MQRSQLSLKIARSPDTHIDTLVQYVCDMALESENITLNIDKTTSAIKTIFAESKYGFYVSTCNDEKIIGSLLITLEYNYIKDCTNFWIQSVYTHPDYRNKGVYRSSYKFVIDDTIANNGYAVKLYVDHDNESARKVYKSLGMVESGEEMWEIDLKFRSSKEVIMSSYELRTNKDSLRVKKLDKESFDKIKEIRFKLVMGEKGTEINFVGLEKMLSPDALGEALVVEKSDKIIGIVGLFFEFSDWIDGLLYYIYDIRVNTEINEDELESVTALIIDKVSNYILERDAGGIRFIFRSEYIWMKENLKKLGLLEPHYHIYEQIL